MPDPADSPPPTLEYLATGTLGPGSGAGQCGRYVVVPAGGGTGPLCVLCGGKSAVFHRVGFTYHPRWALIVGVLLGVFSGCLALVTWPMILVAIAVVTRRGHVTLGLCAAHDARRERHGRWALALASAGAVMSVASLLAYESVRKAGFQPVAVAWVAASVLAVPVGVVWLAHSIPLTTKLIRNRVVVIRGVSPLVRDALPAVALP